MQTYIQEGRTLTLTPAADVAAGVGYLFGAGLFGVALAALACHGLAGGYRPGPALVYASSDKGDRAAVIFERST